jgi:formylglycine-generating enzyme required for sulfatase activity
MDPALQSLVSRLEQLSEQFRELREGVQKALLVADLDPEMALTRARKVLEYVVRDVYERRINEPPGTRPLENLLQRLVKDGCFSDRLNAYANTVRMLGNVGTHSFGEKVTAADVYQSLTQLMPILEWYFEVERPEALGQPPPERAPEAVQANPVEPPPQPETRIAVVPKGLQSFDGNDARFFLQLLPGPRDEHGLPESIRFWKHRIEAREELTFTVGVIYGPSGCGKSSLVKAGLLPRLADHVLPVYVEAAAAETEARLLGGLRKRCPDLPGDRGLVETLSGLRQEKRPPAGQKVLIILDQFEQWLHAKAGEKNTELAQALRQCDGEHVQCMLLVRDDFWVALSRFMGDLQIELVPGQNISLVDLFDLRHARNVLAAFGRAFGAVPEDLSQFPDQAAFLDQAVQGLAQEGRVISVRLALFAEMVKGRPWTPATLKSVGGMEGVGVTFLEETFGSSVASPKHRLHQRAARAVLKALLPDAGSDIKGNVRSHAELLQASGYASHPREFDDLLRTLNSELRLVTPTDPQGRESEGRPGEKYYQLTHDYLVPSLREWLTRKERESVRGRANLRLAGLASQWSAFPAKRQLPTWWEWANIRLFTRPADWTPTQQEMMRQAGRYHAVRALLFAGCFLLLGFGLWEGWGRQKASILRDRLLEAATPDVPGIVKEMVPYRRWLNPLLADAYTQAKANNDPRKQLHASLALLPVDAGQVEYLYERLLGAEPHEVRVLRDALAVHKEELVDRLWRVVETPPKGKESQRLRAAAALARYDPDSPQWERVQDQVANDLVGVPAVYLAEWLESLRPVEGKLLTPLAAVFRDAKRPEVERALATNLLAAYAADQPSFLANLLMDADEKQFAVLYPKLEGHGDRGLEVLRRELDSVLRAEAANDAKEKLAKRQANAAVALLRMNHPGLVWPLLRHGPDPRVRSYLLHRLAPLGAEAGVLVQRLDEEPDVTVRRALILGLGQYAEEAWSPGERGVLIQKVQDLYRTADDPGLHAAAEWLLRQPQWGQEDWLRQTNEAWAKDRRATEKRLERINQSLTQRKQKPQWYVNGQGQTMVVVPGPVEFVMGSPPTEEGRKDTESQHRQRIGRAFAVAATPVTKEQFLRFSPKFRQKEMKRYPDPTCPMGGVVWYEAAAYCNWLSQQEGIPEEQWNYETNPEGQVVKLKENYLRLQGYRLPTEAEWEYACRAGAVTSRYYGESAELLGQYGWYFQNAEDRTWPVGSKKPNDLGLFDMHGPVLNWCQERFHPYPQGGEEKTVGDVEDLLSINPQDPRALRGGSFFGRPRTFRSANRDGDVPARRDDDVGFRPARTFSAE